VEKSYIGQVISWIESFYSIILEELLILKKILKYRKGNDLPSYVMDKRPRIDFKFSDLLPHGAIAWSQEMDNLVETSTILHPSNSLKIIQSK